jgi:hypothetical protein
MAYLNVKISCVLCFGYYLVKSLAFMGLGALIKKMPNLTIYKIYKNDVLWETQTIRDVFLHIENEKEN